MSRAASCRQIQGCRRTADMDHSSLLLESAGSIRQLLHAACNTGSGAKWLRWRRGKSRRRRECRQRSRELARPSHQHSRPNWLGSPKLPYVNRLRKAKQAMPSNPAGTEGTPTDDVSADLHPDKNVLAVHCINRSGPAGLRPSPPGVSGGRGGGRNRSLDVLHASRQRRRLLPAGGE